MEFETPVQQTPAAPAAQPAQSAPAATPATNDTPVAPANDLTPEGRAVAQTLAMAAVDPKFAALPEVKALVEQAEKMKKAAPAAAPAAEKPAVETASEEAANDDDSSDDAPKKKSVFFAKKGKSATPEFKSIEELNTHIKEKYGVQDPAAFLPSVDKWRNDSQAAQEALDRAAGFEKVWSELPDPIYEAAQEWGKGGDWVSKLRDSLPRMDYSKPFEKQTHEIVNQYFPGKFDAEDLKDMSNTVAQNAIEVARSRFDLEKTQIDNKRAQALDRADRQAKALKDSALGSVAKLEESFPDMDSRRKSDVKAILLSGDLNSVFYKKDGTLKPDAAIKLAMALYGEEEMSSKVTVATTKAASKAKTEQLMDTLSRGKDAPPALNQQVNAPTLPEEFQKVLKDVNRKNYY